MKTERESSMVCLLKDSFRYCAIQADRGERTTTGQYPQNAATYSKMECFDDEKSQKKKLDEPTSRPSQSVITAEVLFIYYWNYQKTKIDVTTNF